MRDGGHEREREGTVHGLSRMATSGAVWWIPDNPRNIGELTGRARKGDAVDSVARRRHQIGVWRGRCVETSAEQGRNNGRCVFCW